MDNRTYTSENDEIEIDLLEIVHVILHWMWLIVLSAVIVGAAAFAYSKFAITPMYESTTRIVILTKTDSNASLTYNDLQSSSQLTKDYAELITSRYVVDKVIEKFELDEPYDEFVECISVNTPTNTRIIDITLKDADPLLAKEMVDELRTVAAVRIKEVMDVDAVNLVDEGYVAEEPSEPSVAKWTLIGLVLGGFLSAVVVVVRHLLDDTIKTSEDVERYLQISTLALIPISVEEDGDNHSHTRKRRRKPEDTTSEEPAAREQGSDITEMD